MKKNLVEFVCEELKFEVNTGIIKLILQFLGKHKSEMNLEFLPALEIAWKRILIS